MASPVRVKVRIGQTAMPAQRVGENEIVIEDLLVLDPGDVITVEGEAMVVVAAAADPHAPGPDGPVPQTRITFRPGPVEAAPPAP